MSLENLFDSRLRQGSDNLVDQFSFLQDKHCGNGHYVESGGCSEILISVQFAERHLPLVLLGQGVNDRAHYSAGTTPGSPTVDQSKLVSRDKLVKGLISNCHGGVLCG